MVKKISSLADLELIAKEYGERMSAYEHQILVCAGAGCISCGCGAVRDTVRSTLSELGLDNKVIVKETGCMGTCAVGPVMLLLPERIFYVGLTPENIPSLLKAHFVDGKVVEERTFFDPIQKKYIPGMDDIPFYKEQVRIVLRNCGIVEYGQIESYIADGGGYRAAHKALTSMTPGEVVGEVKASGLRGRGGGGFPTGQKWEAGLNAAGDRKYLVCNADEGDPGAFMDRSVIEGDPHNVIEGMIIGGYAIGATRGFVYIRAEYPIAVERLSAAIAEARDYGLLGDNLFGTDFSFDLEIRIGAGAFVCGEETALMASIEGQRGEPRQKPPFPFQAGLFGKPTIINNVETYANIPSIIDGGAAKFASIGTEKAKGTKVFALAGNIITSGIVEVPIGTKMEDIIYKIGGGILNGKKFKAAQVGGPSGGCITSDNVDVPMDYETLIARSAMMGSGGLIVMDEDTCMVDTARFFLDFVQDESCGKCTACRLGTKRMLEILQRITRGKGRMDDLDTLMELAETVRDSAMCGLGQTSPNPVLSTLRFFREEYEAHVIDKKCPAGVCVHLLSYSINPEKCKGCSACARACPVEAIVGELKKPYVIDRTICVKCGNCMTVCKFGAIVKE